MSECVSGFVCKHYGGGLLRERVVAWVSEWIGAQVSE
jgi:hypothetical protein